MKISNVLLILTIPLGFRPALGKAPTVVSDPWMVFEVSETNSLWRFAQHLGVQKSQIPQFVDELLIDNPRLKDPDLIHPGEHILVRGSVIDKYIPRKTKFKTYWVNQSPYDREPANIQQVQYKAEHSDLFSIEPRLGFSRIDSQQRGQAARATLLSTLNAGVRTAYSWNHRLGPGEISLDLNWAEYNEELGRAIVRNQVFSSQLEFQQGFRLSPSWLGFVALGVYQSPYLFTGASDELVLKVGTQPGMGVAVQKTFAKHKLSVSSNLHYYYNGYAGSTIVDEGFAYGLSMNKSWRLLGQEVSTGLRALQRLQLTEVTDQRFTEINLGIAIGF